VDILVSAFIMYVLGMVYTSSKAHQSRIFLGQFPKVQQMDLNSLEKPIFAVPCMARLLPMGHSVLREWRSIK
jgi:hypothetical protein